MRCVLCVCFIIIVARTHTAVFFLCGVEPPFDVLVSIDTTRTDDRQQRMREGSAQVSLSPAQRTAKKRNAMRFLRWLGLTPKGSEISRCLFIVFVSIVYYCFKKTLFIFLAVFILIVLQRPPKSIRKKDSRFFTCAHVFVRQSRERSWISMAFSTHHHIHTGTQSSSRLSRALSGER